MTDRLQFSTKGSDADDRLGTKGCICSTSHLGENTFGKIKDKNI